MRTDRYYIKKYEDETNRRCYLIWIKAGQWGSGHLITARLNTLRHWLPLLRTFLPRQRWAHDF